MRVETEAELAETIAAAGAPLRIRGGGTRDVGRSVDGEVLETGGLTGISLYEPGALTMVAGAGTPLAEIEAALAAEGQRLAFEPGDWRGLLGTEGVSTIGGVVAANASGPRRIQAGACRDFMLGVRFVDGMGQVVKNGGRVMKNVTGYDLVKLLCGSWGTLGVLTEVSFKVLPKAEATGVLRCDGLDDATAVTVLSRALGSPWEVTGAAHLQKGPEGAPVTMIRLEGLQDSVTYRCEALRQRLADIGDFTVETDPERAAVDWVHVRDVGPFQGRAGDVWRVSVTPGAAPDLVARIAGAEALYDWGGGLIWLLLPEGQGAEAIRGAVAETGGHATLFRASKARRQQGAVFPPQPEPLARIEAGLRAKFDPRGVLNPGLMG
ncbi:MAG: glycolate oxidase subunit GlcE [Rhodobacteraceae bacterium]|nr:MAG: glycolate oxidase subunit GlcE [Paracoccaceae bacterium]